MKPKEHFEINWPLVLDQKIQEICLQVILCQMHSLLHHLTQNMTTGCSLNYEFSTCCVHTSNCSECQNKNNLMYTTWAELVVLLYWTRNSMKNMSSNCRLINVRNNNLYTPLGTLALPLFTLSVNFSRMSPKLVRTYPRIVENRRITMAPLFLRLISWKSLPQSMKIFFKLDFFTNVLVVWFVFVYTATLLRASADCTRK